ncbi:conserved hypothetical protein [Candida albicans WO-1]|uniref:Uncharacterized protein n=1 Tax=Candida albicans (strain WO-1) TaxID=294748 RepID=C4YJI6_CANAW|nr:conserved hypothetical protein [Candida albicans WO-1]
MNCGMIRWKIDPLYPTPFSPVHKTRKFSAVIGVTSSYNSKVIGGCFSPLIEVLKKTLVPQALGVVEKNLADLKVNGFVKVVLNMVFDRLWIIWLEKKELENLFEKNNSFSLPAFSLSHSLHLPINSLPIKINLRTFLARGENSRTSPRGKTLLIVRVHRKRRNVI